jgi:uncharacterized membrane protein YfhO
MTTTGMSLSARMVFSEKFYMGLVIAVSIAFWIILNVRDNKSSFFSGSTIGTVSSICAGCSSVGFYLATTFGAAGVAASSLMSNYQLPLRLLAIGLLILTYYSAHKRITHSCSLNR